MYLVGCPVNLMKKSKKTSTRNIARIAALPFAYECMRRGAIASLPLTENAQYDLIIDSGFPEALFRVKVVKANPLNNLRYEINTRPMRDRKKDVPYARHEVDFIVTCIKGDWYFFSQVHTLPSNQRFNPNDNPARRNNWKELRLPPEPVYDTN